MEKEKVTITINGNTTMLIITDQLLEKTIKLSNRNIDRLQILSSLMNFLEDFIDTDVDVIEGCVYDGDFDLVYVFDAFNEKDFKIIEVRNVLLSKYMYLDKGFKSFKASDIFNYL